jgi:hypothetical protein
LTGFVKSLTLPALLDYDVCMERHQLTIRRVPERVKKLLKELARREDKSLNQVSLEILERGLGLTGEEIVYHDLDDLAGTWVDDPEFDKAIEEQHRVDPELWK